MGKLIETAPVSAGGQIEPLDWALPYPDGEHSTYASERGMEQLSFSWTELDNCSLSIGSPRPLVAWVYSKRTASASRPRYVVWVTQMQL